MDFSRQWFFEMSANFYNFLQIPYLVGSHFLLLSIGNFGQFLTLTYHQVRVMIKVRLGQDRIGQVRSGQVRIGQVRLSMFDWVIEKNNIVLLKTRFWNVEQTSLTFDGIFNFLFWRKTKYFEKLQFQKKTEGNKDFPCIEKLKVIPGKPSVLCYQKSKQKENRTEGNKGTHFIEST